MKLWVIITEKWNLLVKFFLDYIWMGNGKNWKFISSVLVLFFALFTPLLFLVRNEDTNFLSRYHLPSLFQAFEVSGGNFDFGAKKIPYNASSIDLTLSQPIDKASLSGSLFSITPNIPGVLKLKDANTLSYELSEKMEIGKEYMVVLSGKVLSIKKKELGNDQMFVLTAVAGAKAQKMLPEGNLENLSQNVSVFFSVPMVSLSDLDTTETISCPVVLTPAVEGVCHWTTTSVLEFIPKKAFDGATKYTIKVQNVAGLNFPLEQESVSQFETPRLQLTIADSFSPRQGISLHFNYPVNSDEVLKKLSLTAVSDTASGASLSGQTLSGILTPIEKSETDFTLTSNPPLLYSHKYVLSLTGGLVPKYGNMPIENPSTHLLTASTFVTDLTVLRNIYTATGGLVDTHNYGSLVVGTNSGISLPRKDVNFRVFFDEEIPLQKDLVAFVSSTGASIAFEMKYGKDYDASGELVESKKIMDLTLKDPLSPLTQYTLTFGKKANPAMDKDLSYQISTVGDLKVLGYKMLNYSLSCLTLNHPISLNGVEQLDTDSMIFYSSQSGAIRNISKEQDFRDYNTSTDNVYCSEGNNIDTFVYAIDQRLTPETTTTFQLQNAIDEYGEKLQTPFSQNIKTGPLNPQDQYAYIGLNNQINVYPASVPLVLNFQSVNAKKLKIQVCELDDTGYLDYTFHNYEDGFTPKCVSQTLKELPAKLSYWNTTNQRYDLEKDVLGKNLTTHTALVTVAPEGNTVHTEQKIIVKTSLSLALEKANNYSLLYATDLTNHQEVRDLVLSFYDFNGNKATIPYTYDASKKVYKINGDLSSVVALQAKSATHFGVIAQGDQFSNYDFKYISGMDSTFKNYAFVYGDRPIYRPGDVVYFKGLVREFHPDGYRKSSLSGATLTLRSENYETYKEISVKFDANSNFSGSFTIPADSQLGNFNFELNTPNDSFYTNGALSIEQYKKPTFKVDISQTKNDYTAGEKIDLSIEPKYYFGGKVANTDGVYSLVGQKYYFDAKDYQDYQFGEGDEYFDCVYWGYCSFEDKLSDVKDFHVSPEGKYDFSYTFGDDSAERIYTMSFDVTDPDTKKVVSNSVSKVVHATDGYVGVKADYYQSKDKGINMDLVWLDYEAKEMSFKSANIEVIRLEEKDVKEQGVDGNFYHTYNIEEKQEKSFTLIGKEDGMLHYTYSPSTSGMYKIKVSYTGANGKIFTTSKELYVAGKEYVSWGNDNNSVTELSASKTTYKLGETAQFTVKSPVNTGKMLVVLEKDDGILDSFVQNITSYAEIIKIPIKETYHPNVYVKVYLIGSEPNNSLPIYKRVLGLIKVVPDFKKLSVKITPDKSHYKPGEAMVVTVGVVDAYGKPVARANGSLSVVDESVLALKGNPKKNPYSFFYDMKRYLGVETLSNLRYLVEKLEVKDATDGEKGGAGSQVKGGDTKKLRGNFKDTAFWQADFTTDASGSAKMSIPVLPDNLTTWVLESIVSTTDNKIGISYESVQTSLELMLQDNLPRFVQYGDKITLSPQVFNHSNKDQSVVVTLKNSHATPTTQQETVEVKAGESASVPMTVTIDEVPAGHLLETLDLEIQAVAGTSGLSDGVILHLPISTPSTPETVSTIGKTDAASYDEKLNLSNIDRSSASLTVNYGSTLFSYLTDGLDFVGNFPYGCAEQRTSALMPYIYRKALMNEISRDYDLKKILLKKYISPEVGYKDVSVDDTIKEYLTVIKKFQHTDGGFMYWDDTTDKRSDLYLTQYMIPSLVAIKDLGYKVDQKMIDAGSKYLKAKFYDLPLCTDKPLSKCLSLSEKMDLIKVFLDINPNDYEAYKMYLVLKDANKESSLVEAQVLSGLSTISSLSEGERREVDKKLQSVINELLSDGLVQNPRGAFLMGQGTNRALTNALFLEVISKAGLSNFKDIDTITDSMIRFIIASKESGAYGSTKDTQEIIRALTVYLKSDTSITKTNMDAQIFLSTTQVAHQKISPANVFENFNFSQSLKDSPASGVLSFQKTGNGTLYYDISLSYSLPSKDVKERDYGFAVVKTYYKYDEFNKIHTLKTEEFKLYLDGKIRYADLKYTKDEVEYLTPITSGTVGDLVLVYNKIVTPETRDQVAFESFIPSGSEIINTKLSSETKSVDNIGSNINPDREEMRDDRYFAYFNTFDSGIYHLSYTIRLTHAGTFGVKPSKASEFYNPEVFGRSAGIEWTTQ